MSDFVIVFRPKNKGVQVLEKKIASDVIHEAMSLGADFCDIFVDKTQKQIIELNSSVIKNIDTQQTDGKNAVLITLFSIAYGTIIGSIGTPSGGARNVIMINYLQEFSNVHIDYWKWMKENYQ